MERGRVVDRKNVGADVYGQPQLGAAKHDRLYLLLAELGDQRPQLALAVADDASGGQLLEKVRNFGKDSDFGRPGQPVELAPVYVLLASQDGSFINGEVNGVTGGKGIA